MGFFRLGIQARFGCFFEVGMDGPPQTEMSFALTIRPQLEVGLTFAFF